MAAYITIRLGVAPPGLSGVAAMNLKLVLKVLGRVELVVAASMVLPLACALIYREDPTPFLFSMGLILCISLPLSFLRTDSSFFLREGFATVGLIWLFTGIAGGLPFFFDGGGGFNTFWDCIFEASSGFTTTGATILTDIESLPHGILLWRAFTHWLGGMGILVLATALLPSMGVRSHYLAQAESPGPVFSKLVPKQSQTSKILYSIYCAMTAVEVVLLKLAGMPLYDALVHAFSTAGTGGFSNRAASVGAYDSAVIDLIIGVFCLLFSINFSLYFLVLQRRIWDVLKSDELRFFLLVVALATVAIAVDVLPIYGNILRSLRYSFFQVASIISTTGFATADFVLWPHLAQFILIMLMFCGACAGSTGGGIKCSRMLILLRAIRREIHQIAHPRSVEVVRLEGKVVDEKTLHSVLAFIGCYMLILLGTALIVSLDDVSFAVSFSAALTCLSNVGPGLQEIGPVGSFAAFSPLSKVVLSICMIAGRLEIFPILILFSRRTWSRS